MTRIPTVPSAGVVPLGPGYDRHSRGILARSNYRKPDRDHLPATKTPSLGAGARGNCHRRGNGFMVGLRPTSSGSFPPLFAKVSAKNAPAFAQFPQARRWFHYYDPGEGGGA